MAAEEVNHFLDDPVEGTAYCPAKGDMCSARQACLTRFHDAKLKLNKPSRGVVWLQSMGIPFAAGTMPITFEDENQNPAHAKREATATAALLARHCNEVCIIEEALQGPDYSTQLPQPIETNQTYIIN
jgi:hypothetical protein